MRVAAFALVATQLAACSPFGGGAFTCATDADCAGGPNLGRCELSFGYCSFEDGECTSGRRYGTASGAQSSLCVGDEVPIDAPPGGDDATDSPPPDGANCVGGHLSICLAALPAMPLDLPATIDTSTGCTQVIAQTSGPELCVLAGTTVTAMMATRASGPRVLVVVALDSISITGSINASSTQAVIGTAADAAECSVAGTGMNDTGGGGGGAGGSFIGTGGAGAIGDNNNSTAGTTPGGPAGAAQTTTIVRGGCRGGSGGESSPGTLGGTGGHGGGAVYLVAGTGITIAMTGAVYASGAAGTGGNQCAGGGGGGSGGMVGLDAPTITMDGRVAANGGGGGGGGGNIADGALGTDGSTTNWNTRAAGGTPGTTGGGEGGRGSAGGTNDGETRNAADCGGGGGGGGTGLIWTHGTVSGNQFSPSRTNI